MTTSSPTNQSFCKSERSLGETCVLEQQSSHDRREGKRTRGSGGDSRIPRRAAGKRKGTMVSMFLSSMMLSTAAAQCLSLENSTTCPAFKSAKISTSDALQSNFPFLAFVANLTQFDEKFQEYVGEEYVRFKYGSLFGCQNMSLPETKDYYARFTQTVLCSRMIQDSKAECGMSDGNAVPVCAETCGQFAHSEQIIVANEATCVSSSPESLGIIKSDLAICSDPSLDRDCIRGYDNESANCGFNDNLPGLCLYCADSSAESTDTCCYNANAESVCQGVVLPTISNLPPIATATVTSAANATKEEGEEEDDSGLAGGVIAGITVGALAGVCLFALLGFCFWRRKKQGTVTTYQRNFPKTPPSMTFTTVGPATGNYETLSGGRVARMSALTAASSREPSSPPHVMLSHPGSAMHNSSSSDFSPDTRRTNYSPQQRNLHPAPRARNTSLSSASILMDPSSPLSGTDTGSPNYLGSPQSEQLPYFKDYYSNDDIHTGDRVSTLWAYAPRAPDEFELERGDMIKIVGIWDDGWATGIRLSDRAEDHVRHREMRDSGVSASQASHISQGRVRRTSSPPPGEVKAFPLVCVCLPEHWQKTIESEVQQQQQQTSGSDYDEYRGSDTTESAAASPNIGRGNTGGSPRSERKINEKSSSRFKDDLNIPRSPPSSPP